MSYYCLFNDERRFILCVDPKCGCTTIKKWFSRTLDIEDCDKPIQIAHWMRHARLVSAAHDYTKIWFVRDPLRRLVSFYYQFVVKRQDQWCFADKKKVEQLEGHTFEYFIRALGRLDDSGESLQHHLEPQTRFLLGVHFDAIVKIEELTDRSVELMQLLNVELSPGHDNRQEYGQHTELNGFQLTPDELANRPMISHQSFWNEELLKIARKIYAQDCDFYESL